MRLLKIYILIFFLIILFVPYILMLMISSRTHKDQLINYDFPPVLVYRTDTGKVESMSCFDYLCATVAGEMQADYEIEALKAQSVAAYTYMLNKMNYVLEHPDEDIGHSGGYVCDNSAHCMAFLDKATAKEKWGEKYFDKYYDNISFAVKSVIGKSINYNGQPINSVFHSVSSGFTQSALEVWGSDIPYLVSADSSFDSKAEGYYTKTVVTQADFIKKFSDELGVTLANTSDCHIGEIIKTPSGLVKQITVADTVYTGTYIRKLFSLRSSCFDVSVENGNIVFDVYGYGHGVGMSQYGANHLAKQGYTFEQILKYYYQGVVIHDANE